MWFATLSPRVRALAPQAQTFGEITHEIGRVFHASRFSGILGLGFASLSSYDVAPVFDNIIDQVLHFFPCFFFFNVCTLSLSRFCHYVPFVVVATLL
jgi:hypothetical protein